MFYDKEIDILEISPGTVDEDGIFVPGTNETVLKNVPCDVQPYSRDRLYRDYGFDEEVKFRVFSDMDSNIKNGVTVKYKYKNDKYKIIRVIEWDDYLEFFIDNL